MATQLSDKSSVEKIIREMTLQEKAACITGGSSFYSRAMEKYGIPKILLLDGGTGFNNGQMFLELVFQKYAAQRKAEGHPLDDEDCKSRMGGLDIVLNNQELWDMRHTIAEESLKGRKEYGCYPSGMLLGATWSPEAVGKCGHELAKEANSRGIDVLLGSPNVNIHRDPLNGRLFEGYSEDPCLVSKLAPSFVEGVQAEGVIADVKHFAANNQETDRMGVNEHIPERALREIYFPGFMACVQAGCKTVMSAYNKINGVPCAQNRRLLHDVLRDEWGFGGFVVSDWSAAYDQAAACDAGNDLIMPGPRQYSPIVHAVETGKMKEQRLDDCVRHFLNIVLETPAMKGRRQGFDIAEGVRAAYNAAKEGITLLKNDGVLPLKKAASLAFFGKNSRKMMDSGAGSAAVITDLSTNVYQCAADALGSDRVSFEEVNADTEAIIMTVGANGQEGADRPDMQMEPEDRLSLDRAIAASKAHRIPVVVLLNIAGPVQIADWEKDVSAIVCLFIPGMQGGRAAFDILTGKVNPSGKLPLTFPKYYRDCPTYGNFPGYNSEVWYGEGIYVGYRYYEKKALGVMYPFGYGLSYTTFEISDLQAPEHVNADREDVKFSVKVKNTGGCDGAEVVQIYLHDPVSTLDKPVKELKAFRKIYLQAGAEERVQFTLKKEDFASYDTRLGAWAAEPGTYVLMAGNSSASIAATAAIDIECRNPYGIGPQSDIVKVVSNTRAAEAVKKITGLGLRETAGSYIVFQPAESFENVWNECIRKALDVSDAQAAEMKRNIYQEWETL